MNLKYLGKYEGEDLRPTAFWMEPTRYDFEISTKDNEDKLMDLFEKEFKLNCKHQLDS
jgi:hypothetical protein